MTSDLNNMRRQINELSMISGPQNGPSGQVNNTVVQRGPLGTSIVDTSLDLKQPAFYGVLVDRGPADTSTNDFADARYWVRQVAFSQTQGASSVDSVAAYLDASFLNPDGSYGGGLWAVATNLRESQTGTHAMPVVSGTTSINTVLPAGACIVRVFQQAASKHTNIANDFANYIWVFEPVSANGNGTPTSAGQPTILALGTITASGSVTATKWNYTAQSYDGSVVYARVRNGMEPGAGTPGKLGVTVGTDGTTAGGCVIKAIGVGAEVLLWADPTTPGGWMFSQANSAE